MRSQNWRVRGILPTGNKVIVRAPLLRVKKMEKDEGDRTENKKRNVREDKRAGREDMMDSCKRD